MKLTLFQKRAFSFVGGDGENVSGIMYAGWNEKGKAIEFSSKDENKKVYQTATEFDPKLSVDLPIVAKIFDGKVKWREDENVGVEDL